MTLIDSYPNQLFRIFKAEAHKIIQSVLVGGAVKTGADNWAMLGFHEVRALVPIDLAKLAATGINPDAILE